MLHKKFLTTGKLQEIQHKKPEALFKPNGADSHVSLISVIPMLT